MTSPGNQDGTKSFSVGPSSKIFVEYSNSSNPYLDGISLHAAGQGNSIGTQAFVLTRGSSVDNALNTNDTITFGIDDQSIVLAFSNG